MALALRAASGGNNAGTTVTTQVITLPTGTAANDLVYFIITVGAVVSAPVCSGWTLTLTTNATAARSTIVGYRTITTGDTNPTCTWTTAGMSSWTAIGLSPAAGAIAQHNGFGTVTNGTTAATTATPGSFAAGALSGASVILSGARVSATGATGVTVTAPTNWTEPTNGDQTTASGSTSNQIGSEVSYRLAQTGTIAPGVVTYSLSSFSTISHAFAIEVYGGNLPAGSLTGANTAGATTQAYTTRGVGNLLCVGMKVSSTTITPTALSGGNVTTWSRIQFFNGSASTIAIFAGVVTATGAGTITATFSASNSGISTEFAVREFASVYGSAALWNLNTSGTSNNASSTAVAFPSLAPTSTPALYFGFAYCANTAQATVSGGTTFEPTAAPNMECYNTNVTTTIAPSGTQNTAGISYSAGMLYSAASTVITPVGSLVSSAISGATTQAVTPIAVGNVLCVEVKVSSPTVNCTALSGGGVTTWNMGINEVVAGQHCLAMFYGRVTTAGAATITGTFSAATTGLTVEFAAQEFSSPRGTSAVWTLDKAQNLDNLGTASTNVIWPNLTPASTPELYFGFGRCFGTPTAGGTSAGTTYVVTTNNNLVCYNGNVTAALQPTWTQTSGNSQVQGMLLRDTANPSMATLIDDFTTKDTTKWVYAGTSSASGGRAVVPCTADYANSLNSVNVYDLTGSVASIQFATVPALGNGSTEDYFQVSLSSNPGTNANTLTWNVSGASISASYKVGGSGAAGYTATYDSVAHQYLRVRESGGSIFWDSSPDGRTWTNRYTRANPFAVTAVYVQFGAGYDATETAPGNATYDNFNIAVGPNLVAAYSVDSAGGATTTTSSFTPAVGEVLVVKTAASTEGNVASVPTGSVTFTRWQNVTGTNVSPLTISTALVTSSVAMTVSVSWAGTDYHQMVVERWSGVVLSGTPNTAGVTNSSTGTSTITATNASSAVSWISADWNAVSPGTVTYANNAIQDFLANHNPFLVTYAAYQAAGTVGSVTYGVTAPTGQLAELAAIELSTSSPAVLAPEPFVLGQAAMMRAAFF